MARVGYLVEVSPFQIWRFLVQFRCVRGDLFETMMSEMWDKFTWSRWWWSVLASRWRFLCGLGVCGSVDLKFLSFSLCPLVISGGSACWSWFHMWRSLSPVLYPFATLWRLRFGENGLAPWRVERVYRMEAAIFGLLSRMMSSPVVDSFSCRRWCDIGWACGYETFDSL
ncbi:hypothetical protein Bca4012_038044 [Brassica carinata]